MSNFNQQPYGGYGFGAGAQNQNLNTNDFPSLGGASDPNQQQQQQQYAAQQNPAYYGVYQDPNMYNQYQGAQWAQSPYYGQPGMVAMDQQFQQMNFYGQPGYQAPQTAWGAPTQTPAFTQPAATEQPASTEGGNTAFKTEAKAFVPKKKLVKNQEAFPELGVGIQKEAAKPKVTTVKKEEPKSNDVCFGKPKEFFIMPFNEAIQDFVPNDDQMTFMFIHYPEHAPNPVMIIQWLYSMGEWNEQQALLAAQAQKGEDAYNKKPKIGGRKVQNKKGYDYEEEEETTFGMKGPAKAKQQVQAAPPKMPTKEEIEKRNKKKAEAALKQKQKVEKEKDKDVTQLVQEQLVEVDETRQPVSLVFIGHVDAGKSTISGNLMFAMGIVDQRTIQKYKEEAKDKNRESWWLAYVMDINEEEKAKGKTVEVGRATFDSPSKRWTLFDAPGHKNYVPNMIMGAALADYGALVISAKKGEFESGFDFDGQTREHVQLAKSLGIYKLVIVVNKMDEPSVKWSKERYDEIKTNLSPFLAQSGYDPEKDCHWIPVSGLNGDNIYEPLKAGIANWYQGPHLTELLDKLDVPPRDPTAPLRIPVLDKMRDRGVVIFGKVESGTVNLGDRLALMPSNAPCQVQSLYNSKGEPVRYAKPGENVQVRLLNINDENQVNKGDVLCLRDQQMPVSDLFEAEIEVLELLSYKPILSKGYQCILHIHTVAEEATIKDILVAYEKNDKGEVTEKQRPQFTKSFAKALCRIQTRIPISLEKHDVIAQMGRFTLRDEGRTIAVGKVLKYKPAKITQLIMSAEGTQEKPAEEKKVAVEETKQEVSQQIDTSSEKKDAEKDMVYDLDSGEMVTREEFNKRQEQREKELEGIDEGEEDEDDQ